jgi:hypothetical protein
MYRVKLSAEALKVALVEGAAFTEVRVAVGLPADAQLVWAMPVMDDNVEGCAAVQFFFSTPAEQEAYSQSVLMGRAWIGLGVIDVEIKLDVAVDDADARRLSDATEEA